MADARDVTSQPSSVLRHRDVYAVEHRYETRDLWHGWFESNDREVADAELKRLRETFPTNQWRLVHVTETVELVDA